MNGRGSAYIHVYLSCEELSTRWMKEQETLDQLECLYDQQIIRAVAFLAQKPLQARDQSHTHVPLEGLLQLEEFAIGRIDVQVGQLLRRGGWCRAQRKHRVSLVRWTRGSGHAYLCEETFYLSQPFANLLW